MSRKKRKEKLEKRSYNEKFEHERKPEPIHPKTVKQALYIENLMKYQVNIAIGSAGTGKSFIPSAMAADAYRNNDIEKIIVARPYVQTGKSSGAKPGSTLEKMYPYVRPMLDTIKKRLGDGVFSIALKDGVNGDIEVCELESIRGRSFDDPTWLIVDEAQQSTVEETISILTRCSDNCIVTLCGDPNQKDIKTNSGLEWFLDFVERHNLDVGVAEFSSEDIVRGGLVKDIVKGLEEDGYFKTK